MGHHVGDTPAVVFHIAAGEVLGGLGIAAEGSPVHVAEELGVVPLQFLEFPGGLGAFHRRVAQGVGDDPDPVALLHQQRGDLALTVEQVDELGLSLLDIGRIAIGALDVGLHRVKDLILVDIQELHDDIGPVLVLKDSFNDGLRSAGGQAEGGQGGDEGSNGFHRRQGWRRRSVSSPRPARRVSACGNPCRPPTASARDGCGYAALPCPGRPRRPAGRAPPS